MVGKCWTSTSGPANFGWGRDGTRSSAAGGVQAVCGFLLARFKLMMWDRGETAVEIHAGSIRNRAAWPTEELRAASQRWAEPW